MITVCVCAYADACLAAVRSVVGSSKLELVDTTVLEYIGDALECVGEWVNG